MENSRNKEFVAAIAENITNSINRSLHTNYETSELDFDKSFQDYGVDSIIYIRIVIALEDEFEIEFDTAFKEIKSVRDLILLVEQAIRSKE